MASGWGKISESKRHQKNVIFLPGPFTCPVEAGILLVLNNTFILGFFPLEFWPNEDFCLSSP